MAVAVRTTPQVRSELERMYSEHAEACEARLISYSPAGVGDQVTDAVVSLPSF